MTRTDKDEEIIESNSNTTQDIDEDDKILAKMGYK